MPAAPGESFLCAAEVAGQDRHHDAGEEADGSPARSQYGGELQAPGHDRANAAAEVAVSSQPSAVSERILDACPATACSSHPADATCDSRSFLPNQIGRAHV